MEKLKLKKGLQPGTYEAVVQSIQPYESKFGASFKAVYVTDDYQEISELWNASYTPKTKLGQRVKAILGDLPDELDFSDLLGQSVEVTLVQGRNKDFCDVDDVVGTH